MPSPDDRRDVPEYGDDPALPSLPQHPAGPIPDRTEISPEERRKGTSKDDERLRSDPTAPGAR